MARGCDGKPYPYECCSVYEMVFQSVSKCFKVFQIVSRCFKMFQNVSNVSKCYYFSNVSDVIFCKWGKNSIPVTGLVDKSSLCTYLELQCQN